MQKVVLKLDVHDDKKCKQRAMKIATSVSGVDSISLDIKEKKLTLIGNMDPLKVVKKLRKTYRTDIVTIGPVKEPEKPNDEVQFTDLVNTFEAYNYSHYPRYYSSYCYS